MHRSYPILTLLFVFLLINPSSGQNVKKNIPSSTYRDHLDSLRAEFGENKEIPEKYELQCLIALSYYPGLKDIHIVFVPKEIRTTMATRPRPDAIYRKKVNRTYRVFINNVIKSKNGINFDEIPFNAQVGLIGHELGHIVDYNQKSMLCIIANGIAYVLSSDYRKAFEINVDKIAIEHGLGWQLYAFSDFVFNKARISESYREFKKENYPSPQQYKKWLKNYPELYQEKTIKKTFE